MVFRKTRRTYGKKRRGLRRRTTRRPNRIYRSLRPRNVYYFSRYSFYQAPQVALTLDGNGQFAGTIFSQGIELMYTDISSVSMINRGEFTSLFDCYKILSYTVELRPRFDSGNVTEATGSVFTNDFLPTIYWIHDVDDGSYATMSELMEHPKVRSAVLNKPVYLTVKYPTVKQITDQPQVSYGRTVSKSGWIDCNSYQVPHYGIKYVIQGRANTDYKGCFDIRVKWRLAFKNPQ